MKQYQQAVVDGFILNAKEEVLLVKRSGSDDFLPGLWELPGGGIDFGEKPELGLKREIKEEVGLGVEVGKPLHVDDYFMENNGSTIHRVEISFACTIKEKQSILLSHEHSDYTWVSRENVDSFDMTDYMRKTVATCFANL